MNKESNNTPADNAEIPSALALSGGGLRAALFQQGGFLALALRGELRGIEHIAAISGGTLAALSLHRAHIEIEREWEKLAPGSRDELQRQLSIADRSDLYIGRCAGRDLRTRALLSIRCAMGLLLNGSPGVTRCIADEINAVFRPFDHAHAQPLKLIVGVHDLKLRDSTSVVVGSTTDVGTVAAAAMSLPGLMESIVVKEVGNAVCDGGIDDKTALQILRNGNVVHGIVVLDASAQTVLNVYKPVSAMETLSAIVERYAEKLRAEQAANPSAAVAWVSLRDAQSKGLPLDAHCLAFLQQARTDLNYFSPVERLSLVVLGFVLTLHARGEQGPEILERATALTKLVVIRNGKEYPYPLANHFKRVCRAFLNASSKQSRIGRVFQRLASAVGLHAVATPWTVADSLRLILEKSRRRSFQNAWSGHPFFVTLALVSFGWFFILSLYGLAVVALAALGLALLLAQFSGLSFPHACVVVWGLAGLASLAFAWIKRVSDTWPGPIRLALAFALLPFLLPLVAALKISVLLMQEGDGTWSLKYWQTGVGRLISLFDFSGVGHRPARDRAIVYAAQIFLILVALPNPLYFGHMLAPLWGGRFLQLDHLGWFGHILSSWIVQPITVALLSLEIVIKTGLWSAGRVKASFRQMLKRSDELSAI